jgi:hypothetical protein
MPRTASFPLRTIAATATAAVCAAGVAVTMGMSACITAPPPELPTPREQEPLILRNGVFPPANEDLTAPPPDGIFVVPVLPGQPDPSFEIRLFVDFDPGSNNMSVSKNTNVLATPPAFRNAYDVTPDTLDGGVYRVLIPFGADQLGDPNACHWIDVLVAQSFPNNVPPAFSNDSDHTSTQASDSVSWHYVPDPLAGCLQFDAGPFQDGAFQDAAPDGLPVTPP